MLGRLNALGPDGQSILSRLVFFVATPALMLQTLSRTDLRAVFSTPLLVAALSAFAASLAYLLIARFLLNRPIGTALVGAMSASLVNAAYLGIPIAVYVLGDASFAAPVLIFQLAFYTPLFVLMMERVSRGHNASIGAFLIQIPKNPVLVASLLGLLIAGTGWHPLDLLMQPFVLVGGAAVVLAALPTAPNVFITAARYETGISMAKDTVLLTTAVGVPVLVLVSALLA